MCAHTQDSTIRNSFERPSCSKTESNRGRVQTKKSIDNEIKAHPSKCPARRSVQFKSSSKPSTKTPRYEHSPVRTATKATRFEHSPVRTTTKTTRCEHYPVRMAPKSSRYEHSPVRMATTTPRCKHYPVRMAPITARCEHSPVRTAPKITRYEHSPVRMPIKTPRCQHSQVRMAPKTTRYEHSPVRTATKTTRCKHSPIRTATKTTRCEHSPIRTATKTTRCEHSPVGKATKTTRFEHSPVKTATKTTRCEHSPVKTATKNSRCEHSPVRTATKTTRCKHSPVRTGTKTTRCDPSSIRNANNVRRYSPVPIKNADRNRTYSSLPIRSVINTNGDVWLTRAMAKQLDKTHYLGISFREAVVYSLFLLCLTLVACSTMSMWMYWYNRLMNDLFIHSSFPGSYHVMKTFPQIINNNDFWLYTKIVLGRNLWYDIYPDDILDDSSVPERLTMWNVLFENRLIGHPRIRQLQVMNSSCDIHPDLADLFHWSCYGSFSEKTENRTSIGLQLGHAWTHSQFDSFWDSDYYTGLVGSYPYAGFYKDLSSNYEDFIAEIDELITNKWITRATRVVFIDFITYNANVNLFCFIKLVFEFPPVGGIIPSHEIQAFKLLRYVQSHDYLILLLEIFLFLFLLYYSWEEIHEWSSMRRRGYYWSLWSYVDWVILLLGWLYFILYLYRLILVELLLPRLLSQQHHPQFHVLLFIEKWCNGLLVLLLIVAWLKLIKYLNITHSTSRVYDTVSIAFSYLLAGIFLFITILIGFAFCGHILFGSNKSGFYSLLSSSIIIMRCMWGGCYELSYEADIMTTIFFFIFSIVAIIFLGLLLAVLLDSYSTAKRQFRSFDNYGFYLRRRWRHLIAHLRREPPQDIEPNLMNQDEILDLLRRYNFSRPQIDHFLRKYSIHSNTQLDAKEVECLITDMENEAVISQQFSTDSCLDRLESRVLCSVEGNLLSSINSKLNQIKSRIEHLEDRLDGLEPNDFT